MNLLKFIFNKNYRKSINEKTSKEIVCKHYDLENHLEFIYANNNLGKQEIAA